MVQPKDTMTTNRRHIDVGFTVVSDLKDWATPVRGTTRARDFDCLNSLSYNLVCR
jgi:hypothetical protein